MMRSSCGIIIIINLLVAASKCVQSSVYKLTKLVILYNWIESGYKLNKY